MLLQGSANQTLAQRSVSPYELFTSNYGGRYQALVESGVVFMAANSALATLSTVSTTCTGFVLTNPANSTKNLVILDVSVALASAPAGIADIHLALGTYSATAVTHTTPLTVRNCLLGNTTSGVGLVDSAATLPVAPVIVRQLGGGPVAASSITPPFIRDNIDGLLILTPGCTLSMGYKTTAIDALTSMIWAEVAQ